MSDEAPPSEEPCSAQSLRGEAKESRSRPVRSQLTTGQLAFRLVLAFSFLIALLVIAGDQGLHRMARINDELQDITGRQLTKLHIAREAATYSSRNSRITMEVFLLKDRARIDSLLAERLKNSKRIVALIAKLESLCDAEEEKRLLIIVNHQRVVYIDSYTLALHLLLDEKEHDAAATVMVKQTTPALIDYQSAWDDFVRFQEKHVEQASEQSRERLTRARRLAFFMTALAVVIAIAIALLVIRRVLTDLTTRLMKEQDDLRTAHQQAEVFIDAVPSILIGIDRDLGITRWNSTAAKVFGLTRSDVAGKQLTECGIKWLQPGMAEEIRSWFSGNSERRDRVPFEVNGETRQLGLTTTPVHAADETLAELLVIGSDTTDRGVLEEQLRQAQKLESVGQLAAGIAHEINTPTQYIGDNVRFLKDAFQDLKSILANYQGLSIASEDGSVSGAAMREAVAAAKAADADYLLEEIPKAIDQTLEGVARVAKLVGAMKEFSHPGTKEKTQLDLNHAIDCTITVARNEWKYVADLETNFDPSLPPMTCHPGEFNQVILNLIVNAAHAIADVIGKGGSEKGTIKVQTLNYPEWAEIRVQDSGTGIPEKVRARVFDPFFTTKEIGKGSGQGLAIARSVVIDKHGGTLHFETEVGKGTTFVIRLPKDGKALARGVSG